MSAETDRLSIMTWIPNQVARLGSDSHYPEESPSRSVGVDDFWIDTNPVTNRQFATFVEETGYETVAERPLDPADYPGAPDENLQPGSLVFTRTTGPVDVRHLSQWWTWTPGARWNRPFGPASSIAGIEDHPVVHVAFEDVESYAAWAGASLPTEAEWEIAARGGLEGTEFTWGDEPEAEGQRLANLWHGEFPWQADAGFGTTSPVGSFLPNGYGLFDMAGNVWEWTRDWYGVFDDDESTHACCVPRNPRGASRDTSLDLAHPQFRIPRKVIKGGSFLCADSYCRRYRPAARRPQPIDTGMSHIGFRCAVRSSSEGTP
jgi:formylglycine-generating enzyme